MILTKMVAQVLFKDDPAGKEKVKASLNQIKQASSNLSQATSKLGDSLKPLAIGFTAVMGGATVAFNNFISSYDNVAKTVRDIGIGGEAFQELAHSAQQAGISQEKFSKSLIKFSKLTVEAQKGISESADTFKQLGIEIFNADGSARNFEDVLMDFSDVMAQIPDEASRSAIAIKLFGEKQARMGAFLGQGSESLRVMRQRARDLGIVMSEDTLTSVENVSDRIDDLGKTIKGLWASAIAGILPLIERLVTQLQAWTQENGIVLRQNLSNFISGLVCVIQKLLPIVFALAKYWQWLVAGFVAIQAFKVGFAFLGILKAMIPLAIASWSFTASLLANPIVLIVTAVVASIAILAGLFYLLEKRFKVFSRAWASLKNGVRYIVEGFKNIASVVKDKLVSAFNLLKKAVLALWHYSPLKQIIEFLTDPLAKLKNLGKAFTNVFENLGKALADIFERYTPAWLKKTVEWGSGFFSGGEPAPALGTVTPASMPSLPLVPSVVMGGSTSESKTFNIEIVGKSENPMAMKNLLKQAELRAFFFR